MSEAFTAAAKRDLEERDRTFMLAKDARAILGALDYDWREDWHSTARILHERGPFSFPDALHVLDFINWEDHCAR
jgi:hypothetical protein